MPRVLPSDCERREKKGFVNVLKKTQKTYVNAIDVTTEKRGKGGRESGNGVSWGCSEDARRSCRAAATH